MFISLYLDAQMSQQRWVKDYPFSTELPLCLSESADHAEWGCLYRPSPRSVSSCSINSTLF